MDSFGMSRGGESNVRRPFLAKASGQAGLFITPAELSRPSVHPPSLAGKTVSQVAVTSMLATAGPPQFDQTRSKEHSCAAAILGRRGGRFEIQSCAAKDRGGL